MDKINPIYRPAFSTAARYRVLYGGAGSSKSVTVAQDMIRRAGADARVRVLVLRKIHRTCRLSTFKLFTDVLRALGRLGAVHINQTEMSIVFPGGGEILHAGLDDVEKLKSIAGITHIWIEEATELDFPTGTDNEPDLAQIDLRLRGVAAELLPSITITFNPTQRAAAIFAYLGVPTADLPVRGHKTFDDGRVYVQHTTWADNPFVDADYVSVFSRLGGVMQAVYERGELVSVDAADQLIPYEAVRFALDLDPAAAAHDGRGRLSIDVARFGDDETVIGRLEGWALVEVEAVRGQDTVATAERGLSLVRQHSIPAELVAVDSVGVGAGTVDRMRSAGVDVVEIIGGASPIDFVGGFTDEAPSFVNLRGQMWYYLAQQMRAGRVAIAVQDESVRRKITEDLLAPRYRYARERMVEVEPKDGKSKAWGIKQRLGRSPDYGDMLAMGVFSEHVQAPPQIFFA